MMMVIDMQKLLQIALMLADIAIAIKERREDRQKRDEEVKNLKRLLAESEKTPRQKYFESKHTICKPLPRSSQRPPKPEHNPHK